MKTQILEKLNQWKVQSGKSYEDAHEATGYATSTIHRWHKGESEPDLEQLTTIVEFWGGNMQELFADVGKQEMAATQAIGYQGADVMVEHYEARLTAAKEKYELLQAHHNQRIEEINASHQRSVEYLKAEIDRLRGERDSARSTSLDVVGKKHRVFGVLAVICVVMGIAISLLIVLLIIAFKTDAII